ncbi:carboxylesterase [Aspergillus sclerotioniger CBS 115572]|uniref:Carboxylesterase n=1 Tax=Aspergillus sclerotioniger CBS 115572 TaxID=1450535 RepID=A0A317V809_9EURO|nr:carboxylesterase [Aspergillus sclerotioniger CBS 115572]PWY68952.1 carboxylesterase [Aspergillus sclerotioniger CBS 115572]
MRGPTPVSVPAASTGQRLRNTLPVLCGLASVSSAALYETVIETKYGSVQCYPAFNSSHTGNLTHWKDITVWKGIPFAATTRGANRPWNQTLDARNWGPVCPSATIKDNAYTINEDSNSTDAKLPVIMWSYPTKSTTADPPFDSGDITNKKIVFINYNYRTGPFGWLAHSELSEKFENIHANIETFGDDPNQITVQGQSAGSAATQHILYSNLTQGLIVGAIIKCSVRDPHDPLCTSLTEAYTPLEDALTDGNTYLSNLEMSSIAEARNLNIEALISSATSITRENTIMFKAVLDYYAMPDTYLNILMKGLAHDVPVITGNNKDENGATYGLDISLAEYLQDLNETYSGGWIDRSLALYPANDSTTASGAYNSMFTDRSKLGTWLWTQMWYTAKISPATVKPWTAEDYAIAKNMNDYWASFINTRNPNTQAEGAVHWPAVNTSKLVQHVGDGWGQIPIAWSEKVELFEDWFATLVAY